MTPSMFVPRPHGLLKLALTLVVVLCSSQLQLFVSHAEPATQQPIPKAELILWYQERDDTFQRAEVEKAFTEWATKASPGSKLTIVGRDTDNLRGDVIKALNTNANPPDLLWLAPENIEPLASASLLLPIEGMVDSKTFVPALVSMSTVNGRIFGIPVLAQGHLMLFYNKKYVEKAPTTFDELIAISKELSAKQTGSKLVPLVYHQQDAYWAFPIALGFGGTLFERDGRTPALESDAWIKTYQFFYDLKFKEAITATDCDYECVDSSFKAGRAAMAINGEWALGGDYGYRKLLGADLGAAPLPLLSEKGQPAPFTTGRFLALSSSMRGDRFPAARAFVLFFATDENNVLDYALTHNHLPALVGAFKNSRIADDPILAESVKALLTAAAPPVETAALSCAYDAVTAQIRAVHAGMIRPADAAKVAQRAAIECMKSVK